MDEQTVKLVASTTVQLFLGVGAWFLGWRIATSQLDTRKAELRAQLFDERYAVYQAFEAFLQHCVCYEPCHPEASAEFQNKTLRVQFLFGLEIEKYRRQIIANAIALRAIRQRLPCEDVPTIGGLVGYFKGSTNLETIPEIQAWFVAQILGDLRAYFLPYLNYGLAGVDTKQIRMNPPDLPEPPLVRRRVPYSTGKIIDEKCDATELGLQGLTTEKPFVSAH